MRLMIRFAWRRRALSKGTKRVGGPEKAPPLLLQEWLNGSPHSMRIGSHLVLNFDNKPFATTRHAPLHSSRQLTVKEPVIECIY